MALPRDALHGRLCLLSRGRASNRLNHARAEPWHVGKYSKYPFLTVSKVHLGNVIKYISSISKQLDMPAAPNDEILSTCRPAWKTFGFGLWLQATTKTGGFDGVRGRWPRRGPGAETLAAGGMT